MAIAGQVAQAIENAKLYDSAQRRVAELEALARISEAVSESLYLEESLERDRPRRRWPRCDATGAALVLEDGRIAWPEGRRRRARRPPAAALEGPRRSASSSATATRRSPTDETKLLASIANQAAVALEHGRAVMRGVLAQEIHHRVKNNLQTVASLLRLQARSPGTDARKALEDSVNRILAIAAVHEVLTEQRDDDVDLGELVERLRATLVQGVGAGKHVESQLEPVSLHGVAGDGARARLLRAPPERARARRRRGPRRARRGENGAVRLAVSDDGEWSAAAEDGTGLSIVRALVREELRGELTLDRPRRALRRGRVPGLVASTSPATGAVSFSVCVPNADVFEPLGTRLEAPHRLGRHANGVPLRERHELDRRASRRPAPDTTT